MIKDIAFDLDGTIIDSLHECYIMTLRSMEHMGEQFKDTKELEKKFLLGRPFVRLGSDFYVVMRMIRDGKDFTDLTQEEFDKYLEKYADKCKEFDYNFYKNREDALKKDTEAWFSLNKLYPGLKEILGRLSKKYKIVIATAKDTESAYLQLKKLGIEIEKDDIIGKEFSLVKSEQIRHIKDKLGVEFSEIILIEDSPKQIKSMLGLGIRLAMVSWGYNTDKQRQEIRSLGVPVVDNADELEELIKRLNKE